MNTENMTENILLENSKAKLVEKKYNATPKDTRYQNSHVDMETVIKNPNKYIIPQCLPALRKLWDKNIETLMVSNEQDDDLYVMFGKLSDENIALFQQLMQSDPRFIFSGFRKTYGIAVKGNDEKAMYELESLVDILKIQDTFRFQTVSDFLEDFKTKGGEMEVNEYGYVYRKQNPELANVTLQEALKKSGKESLYVAEEGRIYNSPMYLKWHQRYQQSLHNSMQDEISAITPNKDNVDENISHLRDTYLSAERQYVTELLKSSVIRDLIEEVNFENPDTLFAVAQDLVSKVEMGLIPDDQMERTEQQLTVILAAIQDKVLVNDLVLLPSRGGRNR